MLTQERYTALTGQAPPADYDALELAATTLLDALTLGNYADRFDSLPAIVKQRAEQFAAYQVQAVDARGGLGEEPLQSASLGGFSYTVAGSGAVSDNARTLLPFLTGWARGNP